MKKQKYSNYTVEQNGIKRSGLSAYDVREILESEDSTDVKVYKIYKVRPDGTIELKGVPNETFQLESGMFFHTDSKEKADLLFGELKSLKDAIASFASCKIHFAQLEDYVVSVIYPAEFESEISDVFIKEDIRFDGRVDGGVSCVTEYYPAEKQIIDSLQITFEGQKNESMLKNQTA